MSMNKRDRIGGLVPVSSVLCVFLYCTSVLRSALVYASLNPEQRFLGIAPEDESYYKKDVIKCRDGSMKFSMLQLNDDFCDCPDGTDEPGTSACPRGKFYCRNAGHVPLTLFSSRINDGICDCCDGSDEHDGKMQCPNTCWEAGKVARDKLKKKISTYQEGILLRQTEVEKAKTAFTKDEAELSKLKKEESILKGLVQKLKERKEQIEKAEEKERLQREKEEEEKKEAEQKADKEQSEVNAEENRHNDEAEEQSYSHDQAVQGTSDNKDAAEDLSQLAKEGTEVLTDINEKETSLVTEAEQDDIGHKKTAVESEIDQNPGDKITDANDVSENTEGLSREELGRLVASRWTGENHGTQSEETHSVEENGNNDLKEPLKDINEEYSGYASDTDDDGHKYDDDDDHKYNDDDDHIYNDDDDHKYDDNDVEEETEDFREEDQEEHDSSYKSDTLDNSDDSSTSSPSWLEKIQKTVRNIFNAVNFFQIPVNQTEATYIRKEYEESSDKLSKMQSRISSLTKKLSCDFGPEKEFYSLYNHCLQSKQDKYTYKVCPYKQATQEESHSTTTLGRWDKFENSYKVMSFSDGDKCWNGPVRSLKVKLRCGLKNEIADVDEPSRCEYLALLTTPVLCHEEKLKELQHKLDLMNKEHRPAHDEL